MSSIYDAWAGNTANNVLFVEDEGEHESEYGVVQDISGPGIVLLCQCSVINLSAVVVANNMYGAAMYELVCKHPKHCPTVVHPLICTG